MTNPCRLLAPFALSCSIPVSCGAQQGAEGTHVTPGSKLPPDSATRGRGTNVFWLKGIGYIFQLQNKVEDKEFCEDERLEAFEGLEEGRRQVMLGPGTT